MANEGTFPHIAQPTHFVCRYDTGRDDRPVTIEVLLRGAGPLVMLVPSLGRGAKDFDELAIRLAQAGFTSAALNPRGIGQSDGPDALNMSDYARDVMQTASAILRARPGEGHSRATDGNPRNGLQEKAILIGHAFGNRVVRATAAEHPDIVACLVLLAAGGQAPVPPDAAKALNDVFDESLTPSQHMAAVRAAFFAPGNDPEVWRDGWYPTVATSQRKALFSTPPESWTGAGAAPILIVQAEEDVIAPPVNAETLRARFPDRVNIVRLPNAGHAMLPEQPARIAEIVVRHLKELIPTLQAAGQ